MVIDNTNQTREQRARYIPLAQARKIPVRLFYLDTPKDRCMHNNKQREINKHHAHLSKKISSIPIHSFFKNREPPTLDEGITSILEVQFAAGPFDNEEDEKVYNQFT